MQIHNNMKKYLLIAILAVASLTAYAQPRAVGVRLSYGAEVSYEHGFGKANMLSVEVGVPAFKGLQAAVTYDWIDPFNKPVPWDKRGEWHWYMGVGGAVAAPFKFNGFSIGAAGRFGIEYDFWFPLQLSIDFRPTLGFGLYPDKESSKPRPGVSYDLYSGLGLGVRYKF